MVRIFIGLVLSRIQRESENSPVRVGDPLSNESVPGPWSGRRRLKMSSEFMERRFLSFPVTQGEERPANLGSNKGNPSLQGICGGKEPGFARAHQAEPPRSGGHAIKPIRHISFMRIKMAGDKKRRLQKLRSDASPAHCYSQRLSCFASGEARGPGACTIASSPTSCVAQE